MSIPYEKECKFLVRGSDWPLSPSPQHILQGYLASDGDATVRVRRCADRAYLTIKDRQKQPGQSRAEFEYDIPLDHADYLLNQMSRQNIVEKRRHKVVYGGLPWTIDEFLGSNRGLILAEIELRPNDRFFPIPIWAGLNVTGDPRYRNSALFRHPYCEWRTPTLLVS